MTTLQDIKDKLLTGLEERQESDKFSDFLDQLKA